MLLPIEPYSPNFDLSRADVERLAKQMDLSGASQLPDAHKLSHREISVSGVRALEYNTLVGGRVHQQSVTFAKNGRIFIITSSASYEIFDKVHEHYFKVIIDSFETWWLTPK